MQSNVEKLTSIIQTDHATGVTRPHWVAIAYLRGVAHSLWYNRRAVEGAGSKLLDKYTAQQERAAASGNDVSFDILRGIEESLVQLSEARDIIEVMLSNAIMEFEEFAGEKYIDPESEKRMREMKAASFREAAQPQAYIAEGVARAIAAFGKK